MPIGWVHTPGFQNNSAKTTVDAAVRVKPIEMCTYIIYIRIYIGITLEPAALVLESARPRIEITHYPEAEPFKGKFPPTG